MTITWPSPDPYGTATLTVTSHAVEVVIESDAIAPSVTVPTSDLDADDITTVGTDALWSINWYVTLGWELDRPGRWVAEVRHDLYAESGR